MNVEYSIYPTKIASDEISKYAREKAWLMS